MIYLSSSLNFALIFLVKTAQVLISYLHDSPEDLKDMCVGDIVRSIYARVLYNSNAWQSKDLTLNLLNEKKYVTKSTKTSTLFAYSKMITPVGL